MFSLFHVHKYCFSSVARQAAGASTEREGIKDTDRLRLMEFSLWRAAWRRLVFTEQCLGNSGVSGDNLGRVTVPRV